MNSTTLQIQLPLPRLAAYAHFSPDSRIWIYPCSRQLSEAEADFVEDALRQFCARWSAHQRQLQATAEVFEQQLILLMVDETHAAVSGCAIDASVHFLEQLGNQIQVDLFDRQMVGWKNETSDLRFGNLQQFREAISVGEIQPHTWLINTLVSKFGELSTHFWIPFANSWHRRLV